MSLHSDPRCSPYNFQLVMFIREAGGIPFVKTNVPQTLLSFECANPVWGICSNPYSRNHTPGGSSGGEAAILAMDGAALGWGSDIGGSLRIPAHYCGIYSLKPGHGRIPTSNNSCTHSTVCVYRTFTELAVSYRPWVQECPSSLRAHGQRGRRPRSRSKGCHREAGE